MSIFKNRKIVFIRVPKFIFKKSIDLSDIWSHIYGILGTIGLAITIIFTYNSYKNEKNQDIIAVIQSLSFSIIVVTLVFVIVSAYYIRKLQKLRKYRTDFELEKSKLDRQFLVNQYQSECFHNITHYHRNINARLQQFIRNKDDYSDKEILFLLDRFDYYLIVLTSNLQNYFSFVTSDNCSVSIKIVDENKKFVRTFFRDPVNLNKRKKSDNGYTNNKYPILENTAFDIITNPRYSNMHFYDNNLEELSKSGRYINSNNNWKDLYNATLVIPISMVLKEKDRDIIGFITIDNKKGNLATDVNKEFLFGVGDILYNIFIKYSEFINFASHKIKNNDRIETFKMGN